MIGDSKKKEFQYIIVLNVSRFSRKKYDSVVYKRTLEKNGVKVVSVMEYIDDSPMGGVVEGIFESMAQYYSELLAVNVSYGLHENALKGIHTGGKPPLGYDVDPETRKLIINEEEAKIVRIIYDMYGEESKGYNQILNYLNGMGYKTKRGQPFLKNSLYSILHNEKYAGVYVFNKSSSANADGTRNSHKYKNDEDIIRIEGGVPAIVDRETFDKVQIKTQANLKGGGKFKAKETYLLSSLVYCGECNSGMYGNTRFAGRGKSKYSSYRCSSKVMHRGCDNKELRKEYLDNYVLDQLYDKLFSDHSIKKLQELLSDYNKKKTIENNSELDIYKTQLDEVTKKITNVKVKFQATPSKIT
jgi:site-specific DNA recombinase